MSPRVNDVGTGWDFTYRTAIGAYPPPGGIIVEDARHHMHNFAREIRLVGIWLKVEEVTPQDGVVDTRSHFLALTEPPFRLGPIRELTPTRVEQPGMPRMWHTLQEFDDALFMKTYFTAGHPSVGFVLRADHLLPAEYVSARWPNSEFVQLKVSQRFLFSRLGTVPPHEPGGVLPAARCHPMTTYDLTPRPDGAVDRTRNRYRIGSIRFDYRLHLTLDSRHDAPVPPGQPRSANNAGLFRDEDSVASAAAPFVLSGKVAPSVLSEWAASQVAFAAVEKPLVLEVATLGLWEGAPLIGPRTSGHASSAAKAPRCWDNIHWWGARGRGQPMISAPGAFHAAHVHWRWGGAGSSTARGTIPEIDTPAVPPGAAGYWWQRDGMRILVDPAIWIQTIRVAVTRADPLNPNTPGVRLEQLSKEDWASLFTRLPALIEDGDDIVLWYSAEVHRETKFPAEYYSTLLGKSFRPAATFRSASGGTVFLHGLFFAHQAENSQFGTGTTKPEHRPTSADAIRSAPRWYRTA
jgi:hypothetical protein